MLEHQSQVSLVPGDLNSFMYASKGTYSAVSATSGLKNKTADAQNHQGGFVLCSHLFVCHLDYAKTWWKDGTQTNLTIC